MMERSAESISILLAILMAAGCDVLRAIDPTTNVTVRLINTSGFPVDVTIFTGTEQDLPTFLLT